MKTYRASRVLSSDRKRGSSWPIVVETKAGRCFTKLRGAAQSPAALVAEVIVAELAEAIGLRVPARSLIRIDEELKREDRNQELGDLLRASRGLNLGFHFLDGAVDFRPQDIARVTSDEASMVVWLDWLVMNPDRTLLNPNMLFWKGELWLIDHGSALMFHHAWSSVREDSPRRNAFSLATHVLAERATQLAEWDPLLAERLDRDILRAAVEAAPDDFLWPLLSQEASTAQLARRREAYVAFLWKRLKPPRTIS
ncbi:MAG TPA: HipA family kinase [Blastocatellia bacterium]|nr:HipA family kinase [Blastocatellia bacterium]